LYLGGHAGCYQYEGITEKCERKANLKGKNKRKKNKEHIGS
jgi:hypothetical protein